MAALKWKNVSTQILDMKPKKVLSPEEKKKKMDNHQKAIDRYVTASLKTIKQKSSVSRDSSNG